MTRPVATLLLGLGLVVAPACGRKGPLVLPPGRAPMPVQALTATAGDGTVVLRWANPAKEISGRPLGPLAAIEIWVFDKGLPAGGGPLTSDVVEKTARLVRKIPRQEFVVIAAAAGEGAGVMTFIFPVSPQAASPAKLAFVVRVFDRKGRASDFSAPVAVEIIRKDAGIAGPAAAGASRWTGGRP
jgi:predicted small lipoprotein YifL